MLKAVGVSSTGKSVILFLAADTKTSEKLLMATSLDGHNFSAKHEAVTLRPSVGSKIIDGQYDNLRFSLQQSDEPVVTFSKTSKNKSHVYQATTKKRGYFSKVREIKKITEPVVLVAISGKHTAMYFGNKDIRVAKSGPKDSWIPSAKAVLGSRNNFFDNSFLTVGQARVVEQGLLLTYYARFTDGRHDVLTVGASLFDKHEPTKLLWRSEHPLWQQPKGYRHMDMKPIGEVDFQGQSLLFLQNEHGDIYSVVLPLWDVFSRTKHKGHRPDLVRSEKNPLLSPKPHNSWESKATFNPAAFTANGRVHLIYRAIGDDDISTFGYASSPDGVHIDERLDYPIYTPRANFEGQTIKRPQVKSSYASGGSGIGGCEDPRVSLIGETLYMTYVAFDGYNPPRVAMSSISLDDFLNHKWDWSDPVLITPYIPGEGNKNCAILPEKVNGQYILFHRIWPDILIDYVDDLNFDGKHKFLSKTGHKKIKPRKMHWDSRKIGIGASPIKTAAGWLLIYQAVGHQDSAKYKIGAMLLDLKDPSHVIARAQIPVLEPEAWYENEGWKYGVVYPCGAVLVGDDLFVYYGGADTYGCVAKASLSEFLSHLLTHKPSSLEQVNV